MAKKTIKINEGQLRKMVSEAIENVTNNDELYKQFADTTVTDPVGYFYCRNKEDLENILKNGFDPNFIGRNKAGAILGPGFYFFTKPSRYDQWYGGNAVKVKVMGTFLAKKYKGNDLIFVVPAKDVDKIQILSSATQEFNSMWNWKETNINESQLRKMVAKSVKKALNEVYSLALTDDPFMSNLAEYASKEVLSYTEKWMKQDTRQFQDISFTAERVYDMLNALAKRIVEVATDLHNGSGNVVSPLKESTGDERFLPQLKETYYNLYKEYEKWQYATYKPQGMDKAIDAIIEAQQTIKELIKSLESNGNVPAWDDPKQY